MKELLHKRWFPWLVTGLVVIALGGVRLSIVEDFGMSWDEEVQRIHGVVSADYVNQVCGECFYEGYKDKSRLAEYGHAHYGHLFSMLVYLTSDLKYDKPPEYRTVYLSRHKIISMFFFVCSIVFLVFSSRFFGHYIYGLIGILIFTINPRIFAHSFHNPKDIILLGAFMLTMFSLYFAMSKKHLGWIILHGVLVGLLVSTRIVGVLMIPLTLIFLILYKKPDLLRIAVFVAVACLFTVVFWPYLWEDPINRFILSWQKMSHYPFEGTLFLDGKWYNSLDTPWFYSLRWMMITLPIWILAPAVIGFVTWIVRKVKRVRNKEWFTHWEEDLAAGIFCAGILPVLILGSTLYDGWRQLFFLMIPVAIWSLYGMKFIWKWLNKKAALKKYAALITALLIFISLGSTSNYMIKSHPDYQVFFNVLAKSDHWKNYDLDYWGNSFGAGYKAAYDEIDEDIVTISGSNIPAKMNAYFLPKKYREKIRYVDEAWRARYFICNWRNDDFRKKAWNGQWMFQEPVYIMKDADGTPTVGIYKNPYYGIDPNK